MPDDPVLVTCAEAITILGVTEATFARLLREGRFENMGGQGLYRSAELRAYRARDKRRGGPREPVTNAISDPRKTAALSVTGSPEIAPGKRNDPGLGNDTRRTCEGCGKPFRLKRADARTCSPACRKRVSRIAKVAA